MWKRKEKEKNTEEEWINGEFESREKGDMTL